MNTTSKKFLESSRVENYDTPIFAGPLFLCTGCAGALALVQVRTSKMVAIMQCTDCRAHFHADILNETMNESELIIDNQSLKRA